MDEHKEGLVSDAIGFALRAVNFDREGNHEVAVYYYRQAAIILNEAIHASPDQKESHQSLAAKAKEYLDRADVLERVTLVAKGDPSKPQGQSELERAYFLLSQALDEDEAGNSDEAMELYAQAVELCLNARKTTPDTEQQMKLTRIAEQALERAEVLKGITVELPPLPSPPPQDNIEPFESLKLSDAPTHTSRPPLHRGSSAHLRMAGSDSYTEEEKQVLRMTSLINGREYVPFMSVDLRERFAYPIPFTDKDGRLLLSPKQKAAFSRWARPDELSQNPVMVQAIDCFSIKQTVVSDCSFVASLAVGALYEKRFQKQVITSIIYPRNRAGEPFYNPCGKYMVKLHINGVPRKVVIDDLLPLGHRGELLCSYSTNKNELWISLLEKAYMKVMGGYNFPGSNSNIDLHALTGWIPERESIRPSDPAFNKDGLFKKLHDRIHKGDVLVTVATGEMSEQDAERAGLVPTHAYAVLDSQEVDGVRLFLLKNPWSHLRWRGNYSELDTVHWTPKMRSALKFDPNSASMFDNGVFWIDYESLCRFFDVFYMNWNPRLFRYTYCIHQTWKAGTGPVKDAYNVGDNPQYSLEVRASGPSAVWILLSRHITELEDFKENQEYITTLVYQNEGKKVYYPYDPAPYIDGVRINSPHYLCKISINAAGTFRYTVVVSQYEKMNTIHYTLRTYSTCPFAMNKIGNPFKDKHEVRNGSWTGKLAGGCANHPNTYPQNPCYQVVLDAPGNDHHLLVDLKGPKKYQVGFDIVCVVANDSQAKGYFNKKSSGQFRTGFAILELEDVPRGTYNIIPCTYLPGQEGPFFLTVQASCKITLSRIQ